jgi:hypothetical protein
MGWGSYYFKKMLKNLFNNPLIKCTVSENVFLHLQV